MEEAPLWQGRKAALCRKTQPIINGLSVLRNLMVSTNITPSNQGGSEVFVTMQAGQTYIRQKQNKNIQQ
jgi:hypothetical protein